ncbi:nitroreductase [Chloroflexota bacterium]
MELLEGIETRRTWRGFKDTPIPTETLRKILQAASNSPSYTNTQPWEVAVVTGEKKAELSKILCDLAKSDVPANPDMPLPANWPPELEKRAREHGSRRYQILGIERSDVQGRKGLQLSNLQSYGAPCVLFLFQDNTLSPWSIFDIGLFAENILLAAHSFGVGSCLQAALAHYAEAIHEFLGTPKTQRLILGIALGYPDPEAKLNSYQSEKAGLDTFTKWYP